MTNPELRLRCLELAQEFHLQKGEQYRLDESQVIKIAQKYLDFIRPKEIK